MYDQDLNYDTETAENSYKLSFSVKTILKDASMKLRKFYSNSKYLK